MKTSKHYPIGTGINAEQLAAIMAQAIHFARGLWDHDASVAVSHLCACLLAQNTDGGRDGVESDLPEVMLRMNEAMPYEQRLALARELVAELEDDEPHPDMYPEDNDSPELQNCDDWGTGEGQYHGRM